MEETRPPPVEVVSWAATSEAAARMATCENFMVKYVVVGLIVWKSCLLIRVELMMNVAKKQYSQQGMDYIPSASSLNGAPGRIHTLTDLVTRTLVACRRAAETERVTRT